MRIVEDTPQRLALVEWRPLETAMAVVIVFALSGLVLMTAFGFMGPVGAALLGVAVIVPLLMLRNLVFRRRLLIDRSGGYVYATTLGISGKRERVHPLGPDSRFEIETGTRLTGDGFTTPNILELVTGTRRMAVFDRPERNGGAALAHRLNGWLAAAQTGTAERVGP